MNLNEAIEIRRSRRKYVPEPLGDDKVAALRELIDGIVGSTGLRLELVLDNGAAFASFRKSYGMFTGVLNYVGCIAELADVTSAERLGYYGEIVNLSAVAMGLGTCWVGGSFDRAACPFAIDAGEEITCVIVVGPVEERTSVKERLLRGAVHRHTKSISDMVAGDGSRADWPEWFVSGMEAVQKAPSAMNRQSVEFSYADGVVSATVPNTDDTTMLIDLGIAKLHFEKGAGGGNWQWGNGGRFTREPGKSGDSSSGPCA